MRLLKKVLSVVLAVSMCIPSGGMGFAYASETDSTQSPYLVTIEPSENGKAAFTNSEEDVMTVSAGEQVELSLTPDDGYEVSGFALKDAGNGKVIASKETTDNMFSFTMPAKDLVVSAEFTSSKPTDQVELDENLEDISGSEVKENESSSYEILDEKDDPLILDEVQNESQKEDQDLNNEVRIESSRTTSYIANNLDDNSVNKAEAISQDEGLSETEPTVVQSETDKAGLAPTLHTIMVNYNLVDASGSKLRSAEFDSDALVSAAAQSQQIYAIDGNEDCFVAFIDLGKMNGIGDGVTATFSNSDINNAVSYTDQIQYDAETGIAYIPKSLFYNEQGEEIVLDLQAQVFVPYSIEEENKNTINISVENNNASVEVVAESQRIAVPSFDVTVTFPLVTAESATRLDMSKVSVYVNDSAQPMVFSEGEYFFNDETGELTIAAMPITVYSIRVVIEGDTLAQRVMKTVATTAEADIARQIRYESDIKMVPDVYLDVDYNTIRVNQSETLSTDVSYMTDESIGTQKGIVTKYFEYLCYVGNNYTNSLWAAQSILNGSAQLGDFVNDTRTDFGDSTGTALSSDMLELYNYLFTLPLLTNADGLNNQKLPLHSIMLFQGENAENNFGSTVAADLAARPLKQEVTVRCLHKDTKNGIKYGVFGFAVSTTDGRVAAYGIYKIPVSTPVAYIQIQKESAIPDATDGNIAYTYEGAQFQILNSYGEIIKDERTGSDVFTLDATGKSDVIAVPVPSDTSGQTYIVKEITAPKGYKLAPDQEVKVNTSYTASSPYVVRFIEEPYTYDADIIIDKFDSIATYSQGDAQLAGIKFEVLYYPGYDMDDFSSVSGEPERVWTITTKMVETIESVRDNGIVREYTRMYGHTELQEEYLVKGESDELYKDNTGKVILPLGTYIVREKDAGDGYKISGEMYVMQDGVKEPNFSNNKQGTTNPAQGLLFMIKANVPETNDYRSEIDTNGNRLDDYEVYKTTGYVGTTAANGVRVTNIIRKDMPITATDTAKYGGFEIQKLDVNDETNNTQGNAESMSGRYGVKNLSDHAVTIRSENGIQINDGYASKWTEIDGVRWYTFEPVADNNMTNYMFTFTTNDYGYWRSSTSLLPYGTYEIDELIPPEHYQKNGVVNVKFEVREDGTIVTAPNMKNMIDRGGFMLIKFDADDQTSSNQGSGELQGTYTLTNRSSHYVWILDHGDGEINILRQNADKNDGPKEVTGEGIWYKFAPGADMFTITTKKMNGYQAAFISDPYLLPYGTYEIRETGTTDSYIISELRGGNNKATFSITKLGEVVEFGTNNGIITDSSAIMSNPVVRGGFTMQKNDADRKDFVDGDTATSRVPQGDAVFTNATYKVTTNNDNYVWIKDIEGITVLSENAVSSKEIEGESWYKFTKGADMYTFKVDANGDYASPADMLPFGSYTITEVTPSDGYLGTEIRGSVITHDLTITSEGQIIDFTYAKDAEDGDYEDSFYEAVIRGGVKIQKNDADVYDKLSTTAQGDATFEGAVYNIYNISKNYVWVDTNNDGTYSDDEYYKPIGIDVSDETAITYEDVKDFTPVYSITTDADGFAQTGDRVLPYGTYLIVEKTPSEGYLNGTMRDGIVAHTFEIREEGVIVDNLTYDSASESGDLTNTFYEPIIRGGFDFQKNDEETGTNVPLGGTNLHGVFTVTNVSDSYVWIKEEEGITLKTDGEDHYYDEATGYHLYGKNEVMFTFETDRYTGKFQTSTGLLPYGSYKIQEIEPPNGYLIESNRNPDFEAIVEIREEGVLADATQLIYNFAMRGDFNFEKKDAETGLMMQYIPFLITSLDQDGQPIESHVVYTGLNGNFSTEADFTLHTYKTNKMDETIADVDRVLELLIAQDYDAIEELLKDGAYYSKDALEAYFEKENYGEPFGVWFGVNTKPIDYNRTATLERVGALPFGRYRIDELPCEANEGKLLVHNSFTILTEANRTTPLNNPLRYHLGYKSAGIISYGTIYNWEKPLAPQMTTSAAVRASDTQFSGTDSVMVITDKVHYQGLIKDKDYTLVARVVDAVTGENLRDITGDIAMSTKYLTPNTTEGYIDMEISVDTKGYEGCTVVVYETLYDEFGDVFIDHSDPDDEAQQIHFPNVDTKVIVESTQSQVSGADKSVTVIDTVSYSNLSAGTAYNVKSYLIDAETGAVIVDASGKRIESEQPFKPTTSSGTFEVRFTFNATELAGKKVVVCEEILENGYVISAHNDKNNNNQAVWFPALDTNAMDKNTKTQMSFASGKIVVTDKISYTMVKPGMEYTVNGVIVDAKTEEVLATASTVITPSAENGSTSVTFNFDGNGMDGRTVVAFASMTYNSVTVASHEDIEDQDEMIYVAGTDTSALDAENQFKLSKADKEVSIVDTVSYENLVPGYDYTVSGYLVDAETGIPAEDASGDMITASESFTATEADGSIDVIFTFDGSKLAGKTLVVFESINVESGRDVPTVAEHEDLDDDDQTIRLPKLVSNAFDKENSEHVSKPETINVSDNAHYSNLIAGVEYTLVSKVVVKETREIVSTQTVKFTPTSAEGDVLVEHTVDASRLAGNTLVFVEDLQYNGFSVAEANNMNDQSASIRITSISTSAVDGENGTHVSYADESVTITDTVTYKNLIPGKQYVMFGKVIDRETGEVINARVIDEPAYTERGEMKEKWICEGCSKEFSSRDEVLNHIDASASCETFQYILSYDKIEHEEVSHYGEIAAIKPFIPTSPDGTVIMEFNFDGTELADRVVVVYEELYMANDEGIILTEHYDCTNGDGKFGTKAEVEEHFRQSNIGCNTYSFYYTTDMFSVGEHKDQYDDAQTVYIPALTNTEAGRRNVVSEITGLMAQLGALNIAHAETVADIPSGNHFVESGKDVEVNYTVKYSSFQPGQTYKIVGKLVDKETGEDTGVQAVVEGFRPDAASGTLQLTYNFDSTPFAGMLLVPQVFAYINGTDIVASLEVDGDPTIYVVKVDTEIKDDNTNDNVPSYGVTTITDTVVVSGLKPETEYQATGTLMDPKTGNEYKNIPITMTVVGGTAPDIVLDDKVSDDDASSITYEKTEDDDTKKSVLEWLFSITIGKLVSPTTKNSVDFKTEAGQTMVTVAISYEIDTRTMSGESVVSYVQVKEKKTGTVIGGHEDPDDDNQTLHVASIESYETLDAWTATAQATLGKTVIGDKVKYSNLVVGKTYMARANIVDADTKAVLARISQEIEPAESASDTGYQMTFYVDTSNIIGKTVFVTEELYLNGVQVAFDQSSEIYVASISTDAISEETDNKSVPVAGRTTIVDTITYNNLIAGKEYVATGKLINKDTEKVLKVYDKDGKEAKDEIVVKFTPSASNGTVKIPFTIDTTDMSGDSLVAYASISLNGYDVAVHNDILDVKETTYVPTITSTVVDAKTGNAMISNGTDAMVVDTVKVGNLVVGQTYVAEATIISDKTGETVATASGSFEATASNMTVRLELKLNANDYAGDTLICTDSISTNGVELIRSSKGYKLYVGKVSTEVRDRATGIAMAEYDIDTKVVDTIKYENFVPGAEYSIHGELISKKTGKVLDSKDVKAVFNEAKGTFDVEFEIDTTKFDGRQFVAMETISLNGAVVAAHEDIDDEAQTMNVAEIGTEAFINGQKEVKPAVSTLLIDTVDYENLKVGYEYDMIGTIIDVQTGQVVKCNDIPVTTTVSFVAEESNGTIDMPFTFDTTSLEGKSIVVYEELKYNNVLLAEHKDINSAKQTVTIKKDAEVEKADAKVTVKYLDKDGEELAPSTIISGKVDDAYTATAKDIQGYKLSEVPKNATGTMTEAEIVVMFIYELDVNADAKEVSIISRYVDTDGKSIKESTVLKVEAGKDYEVTAPEIQGYKLKETPANATGKAKENTEVVFVYEKVSSDVKETSRIIVKFTDTITANEISEQRVIEGNVGDVYTIKAKEIKGWKLLSSVPESVQVEMTKEERVVKFIYEKDDTEQSNKPVITVKKTFSNSKAELTVNKAMTYTVTVAVTDADAKNVVIRDSFDEILQSGTTSTLSIPNVAIDQKSVVVKDKSGNKVTPDSLTFSDSGEMTIKFDTIKQAEMYTITYSALTSDTKLIGKEVTNTVYVKADDVSDIRANKKVKVVKATTGTTNSGNNNNSNSTTNNSSTSANKTNGTTTNKTTGTTYTSTVKTGTGSTTTTTGTTRTVSNADNVVDGVKTGDDYTMMIILIAFAMAMGATAFILLKKKRK